MLTLASSASNIQGSAANETRVNLVYGKLLPLTDGRGVMAIAWQRGLASGVGRVEAGGGNTRDAGQRDEVRDRLVHAPGKRLEHVCRCAHARNVAPACG